MTNDIENSLKPLVDAFDRTNALGLAAQAIDRVDSSLIDNKVNSIGDDMLGKS